MSYQKLAIYYDGACYACYHEILLYQKKDPENRINYIDISKSTFDATKEGLDPIEVNRLFHVRLPNGEYVTGVSAFIAIWQTLDSFNFLVRLAEKKFFRALLEAGYMVFVRIRPYLPRRKCETDTCQI